MINSNLREGRYCWNVVATNYYSFALQQGLHKTDLINYLPGNLWCRVTLSGQTN